MLAVALQVCNKNAISFCIIVSNYDDDDAAPTSSVASLLATINRLAFIHTQIHFCVKSFAARVCVICRESIRRARTALALRDTLLAGTHYSKYSLKFVMFNLSWLDNDS